MAGDRDSAQAEAKEAIRLAQELGDTEAEKNFQDVLKMASGWVASEGSS